MHSGRDGDLFLSFFVGKLASDIGAMVTDLWTPPQELARSVQSSIEAAGFPPDYAKVVATGETENSAIYVLRDRDVIVYTPLGRAASAPVVRELAPRVVHTVSDSLHIVERTAGIAQRLDLPKVILINPSVKDVFPAPRLALCVSYLASYLRSQHKAEVQILDMQFDLDVEHVIRRIRDVRPEVIGISISFGQMELGTRILREVFAYAREACPPPVVVAGNAISAFGCEGFLSQFPDLLICTGEGERSLAGIVDWTRGQVELDTVPGIAYRRRTGNGVVRTPRVEVEMSEIPSPAMDTVGGILAGGGALIMETSRGCRHSRCSFCPRTHKSLRWKGMSPSQVVSQLDHYGRALDNFGGPRRIFFVDEDFFGTDDAGDDRARSIMRGMLDGNMQLEFEADTRVDQVYSLSRDTSWHLERMKTLLLCQEAGLHRLLLGVESGSSTVLGRFRKGISVDEAVFAMRLLTALGIGLRTTFITFDPLMNFAELKDDLAFLARRDILLRPQSGDQLDLEQLFWGVHDHRFVERWMQDVPFYENVCYMLVSLEVLIGCEYLSVVGKWEKEHGRSLLAQREPDYSMARYRTRYVDSRIGAIAENCQRWLDRHFALDYCLKGRYKVVSGEERKRFLQFRRGYRKLSFELLESLVWLFDRDDATPAAEPDDLGDILPQLRGLKRQAERADPDSVVQPVLELMNARMEELVSAVERDLVRGQLSDPTGVLTATLARWRASRDWGLINP
ncbi:MAG TPA: radical SAM protein [Anaerolineae bacterium]|nr:radical SAM protein [Anaerolineae bacterium]